MDIEMLISLADEVLAASEPALAAKRAAAYANSFAAWEVSAQLASFPRETLEKLQDRHQKVVSLVESLAGQAAGDLRKLRQKGRGIRAYLNRNARSVSVIKPTKG
jgi:hypothetical protein